MSRFTHTLWKRQTETDWETERDGERLRKRESGWAGFLYLLLGTWSVYLMVKAESLDVIFYFASDPVAWHSHWKVGWLRSHSGSQDAFRQRLIVLRSVFSLSPEWPVFSDPLTFITSLLRNSYGDEPQVLPRETLSSRTKSIFLGGKKPPQVWKRHWTPTSPNLHCASRIHSPHLEGTRNLLFNKNGITTFTFLGPTFSRVRKIKNY